MVPILIGRHELPIECVTVQSNTIVSASLNGQLFVWNSNLGINYF